MPARPGSSHICRAEICCVWRTDRFPERADPMHEIQKLVPSLSLDYAACSCFALCMLVYASALVCDPSRPALAFKIVPVSLNFHLLQLSHRFCIVGPFSAWSNLRMEGMSSKTQVCLFTHAGQPSRHPTSSVGRLMLCHWYVWLVVHFRVWATVSLSGWISASWSFSSNSQKLPKQKFEESGQC